MDTCHRDLVAAISEAFARLAPEGCRMIRPRNVLGTKDTAELAIHDPQLPVLVWFDPALLNFVSR
jgi:hypothetical protein